MIRAFKSSSNSTEIINLDRDAIRENHRNGRQTNIMFDTNILIAIESAYKTGQRHQELKNAGVLNSRDSSRRPPGMAYSSRPQRLTKNCPQRVEATLKQRSTGFLQTICQISVRTQTR